MNGVSGLLYVKLLLMDPDELPCEHISEDKIPCEHIVNEDFSYYICSKPSTRFYFAILSSTFTCRCEKHLAVDPGRYIPITHGEYIAGTLHQL